LCTYKPSAKEVGGLEFGGIFVINGSELCTLIKNLRSKLKKLKTYRG
jgi:hypothetical protein